MLPGGIIGGVIVFFWRIISWTVLPWHLWTMHSLADKESLLACIQENIPVSGIYYLLKGPLIFLSIDYNPGLGTTLLTFIVFLAIQIIAASIISWLLLQAKISNYMKRVRFVTITGVAVAVLAYLPSWNWMHFSTAYTFVNFFDAIVGWFLASFAIAKFTKSSFF